jgi:hypothetical protein
VASEKERQKANGKEQMVFSPIEICRLPFAI